MLKPLSLEMKKPVMAFFVALLAVMLALPANAQLLEPSTQAKFVNPLPIPGQIDVTNGANLQMQMNQTTQWLGLTDPLTGTPFMTTVWGYGPLYGTVTYPGPTFVAKKNVPVNITWMNNLPGHFLPVDASLHMAHPSSLHEIYDIRDWYAAGNVPTVAHLHGGHTESASDGLPEAWFTQNFNEVGQYFVKQTYTYHNDQEAATLWYHDHALGITRLNVYAGLAGFYLLEDNNERKLTVNGVLPKQKHDIEIVIQDRMFDNQGQLFWPAYEGDPAYADFITGEGADLTRFDVRDGFTHFPVNGGPTALAEFFGDFILVNGVAWPFLDVEPRPYRFRLLNGSDSRFYVFRFEGEEVPFLQIGTDDGLLPQAVQLTELVLAPGERAEIVVDFAVVGGMGNSIKLLNFGPDEPYGGGTPGIDFDPADAATTGQIMQFNVNKRLKETKGLPLASVVAGTVLRDPLPNPATMNTDGSRQLVLFEGTDEYGRLMPMLGTLSAGSLTWSDPITENPGMNDVEEWEVYNATGDAHPIHLHLVSFLIKNRQAFDGVVADKTHYSHSGEEITGGMLTVNSYGDTRDAEDNEKGWKDTAIMLPDEVTRVIARFDRPGRYVWHCHILSHEDHEMMRPFHVGALPAAGLKSEAAEDISVENLAGFRLYPNPVSDQGFVEFTLEESSNVRISLYDLDGRLVKKDDLGMIQAGSHTITMPMGDIAEGLYILELNAGQQLYRERMVIAR
jgi:spore coat protein A